MDSRVTFNKAVSVFLCVSVLLLFVPGVAADQPHGAPSLGEPLTGATIVELQGCARAWALSHAVRDDEVRLLSRALLADGFRPGIGHATAYEVAWQDDAGSPRAAQVVVIPFSGNADYVGITYGTGPGMQEVATAVLVSGVDDWAGGLTAECCTDECLAQDATDLQFRFYHVEQGAVQVETQVGNPCTFMCIGGCLVDLGISVWAVIGCIGGALTCWAGSWPGCVVLALCDAVVIGCAIACCID